MTDIFQFLDQHQIAYERHDHPPVYTVADVLRLIPNLPGAKTKNLFFRDKKGRRHFLVIVNDFKRVDMKQLAAMLDADKISFGSPPRLQRHLGIEPGSVSLLAVINDVAHAVEVVIDTALWQADAFQFHPLVNTSTLVVTRPDIEVFLNATGHAPRFIPVPEK